MRKYKMVAAVLAIIPMFGIWGFHKFYLNENGKGLTYVFISLTCVGIFITWPMSFFKAIGIARMDDAAFDKLYNSSSSEILHG